jgi:hypothetical protein
MYKYLHGRTMSPLCLHFNCASAREQCARSEFRLHFGLKQAKALFSSNDIGRAAHSDILKDYCNWKAQFKGISYLICTASVAPTFEFVNTPVAHATRICVLVSFPSTAAGQYTQKPAIR